jgi:protein kinase-like protein
MPIVLRSDFASSEQGGEPSSLEYSVLGTLSDNGRAEVLLALLEGAEYPDKLVVIKKFWPATSARAPEKQPAKLIRELEFLAQLEHENIARALSMGREADRAFLVSEYLDGASLATFSRWASWAGEHVPNAAVARILLAILDAVRHAHALADSDASRSLVNQPVLSADVFITYDGCVKLLGLKSRPAASRGSGDEVEPIAIDALLSRHLTPELSATLARLSEASDAPGVDPLEQMSEVLRNWQDGELGSDGRAEIASIMSGMLPQARAEQAARLRAAFARGRAEARGHAEGEPGDLAEEMPPLSGYRLRSGIHA